VRGQEIQGYLQKLKDGKISFSHKLQDVNRLASSKTTARELLSATVPNPGDFDSICLQFNLFAVLDRLTSQLSGGELQRLAIACCLGREAQVYCLDEPSSYLDVSERLKAAKAVKKKSESRPVVVVEHDLALLDYLSDYVHVLYGASGAYGVVSQLKGSRNGINDFLSGYLPEENVRFRDHQIRFSTASHANQDKGLAAFDYPSCEKTFKGFRMSAQPGTVYESEIIGILGPNAVGKTTFIRMLAGELESDSGKVGLGKKAVSYKPQYLSQDFEGSVRDFLASDPAFDPAAYSSGLRAALCMDELEEKTVRELSGGELQRASIALCLSKKADIYLLDEPSAFLDIEQRLLVAETLRRTVADSKRNAFVIDHDLVLVDSVSDRLVVFSGTPSVEGKASAPVPMREGMNSFLKSFEITFRRDEATGRPRANKEASQKDAQQKRSGEYYYE
jgi:ATP-binding cassette subfamily E protein 1